MLALLVVAVVIRPVSKMIWWFGRDPGLGKVKLPNSVLWHRKLSRYLRISRYRLRLEDSWLIVDLSIHGMVPRPLMHRKQKQSLTSLWGEPSRIVNSGIAVAAIFVDEHNVSKTLGLNTTVAVDASVGGDFGARGCCVCAWGNEVVFTFASRRGRREGASMDGMLLLLTLLGCPRSGRLRWHPRGCWFGLGGLGECIAEGRSLGARRAGGSARTAAL